MMEENKLGFWDENKVYIGIFLLLLCFSLVGIYWVSHLGGGNMATIQQGQEILAEFDLNQVEEAYEWTIYGADGAYNILSIEPGQIAITEANCPDQICVNRGYSQGDAAPIICLPHQVLIRFSGETYDEFTG